MAEKTGVFALRDKGLTAVPDKVYTIANLRTLDLSHNKIVKVLPKVRVLAGKLKTLSLDANKLADLPDEICTLRELQSLTVGHNSLTRLCDEIGMLNKLKTLVVSHNRLTMLPESMCTLSSLTHLDASSNCLAQLPAGFGALSALAAADLSNNQLGALPDGLGELRRLKDLDLRQNAPLVVHGSVPPELLLQTPLHRLEVDPEMLGTDGTLAVEAAGGLEAQQAYLQRRKARIDKEVHAKARGGELHFGQ